MLYIPPMRGLNPRLCRTTALGAVVALTLALALGTGVALLLAPAVALFCLLMLGLRPGEQMIERLREHRRPRGHRAPRAVPAPPRARIVPRTSWLAASPLAMRPPPVALAAIT